MECARHSVGSESPHPPICAGAPIKGHPTSRESGATPDASKAAATATFAIFIAILALRSQTSRSVYDPGLGMLDLEIITCDEMQVQLCY